MMTSIGKIIRQSKLFIEHLLNLDFVSRTSHVYDFSLKTDYMLVENFDLIIIMYHCIKFWGSEVEDSDFFVINIFLL